LYRKASIASFPEVRLALSLATADILRKIETHIHLDNIFLTLDSISDFPAIMVVGTAAAAGVVGAAFRVGGRSLDVDPC